MPLLFEDFDAAPAAAEHAGPPPDWLDGHSAGFREGLAQGRAEAEAESSHLSRELAQSLQEMAFGYAEAREQVLLSLRPLFGVLIDRLLPAFAAEALGPWVAETLLTSARTCSATPLEIELHPDRIEAVRPCLPPGLPATLLANPSLGPGAARFLRADRESDLDIDACLAALQEALAAFLDHTAPTPAGAARTPDDPSRKVRHG